MTRLHELKAAVVGTGFIGAVHADALRRLRSEILGGVGSTPDGQVENAVGDAVSLSSREHRRVEVPE